MRFSGLVAWLRCERVALEDERLHLIARLLRGVGDRFAQHLLGVRMAFSAAGADTELVAQLRHAFDAAIDGLLDFAFGNVIADADDH
jgi:hypothetical protein